MNQTIKNLKEEIQKEHENSRRVKDEGEQQWQEYQSNKNLWNNILNGIEEETKGYKQNIFDLTNLVKSKEK